MYFNLQSLEHLGTLHIADSNFKLSNGAHRYLRVRVLEQEFRMHSKTYLCFHINTKISRFFFLNIEVYKSVMLNGVCKLQT